MAPGLPVATVSSRASNQRALKLLCFSGCAGDAAILGGAAKVVAMIASVALLACALPACRGGSPHPASAVRVYQSTSPDVGRCAWYGTRSGDRLLFGISAFWSAGEPTLGLTRVEATEIGRFDLADERLLPSGPAIAATSASGVWDVVATAGGGLFFTSLGGRPGVIDASGETRLLEELGTGSNEVIALPADGGGGVAYSDYDSGRITLLDASFDLARHIDMGTEGPVVVAPKSLAYDPKRNRLWITTDLLDRSGGVLGHDTRVHDFESGGEIARIIEPEIHMFAFSRDGAGYFVFAEGHSLWLERHDTALDLDFGDGERILLERNFARDLDFAQELRIEADGRVVITRWSGAIHVIERDATLRTLRLPRPIPVGLFYSAALRGKRVCATYCSGVRVVCGDLP